MTLDAAAFWSFFCVFLRCSAGLLTAPVFGAPNAPVQVRVLTMLGVSAAIATTVHSPGDRVPATIMELALGAANELAAGMLIGVLVSLVLSGVQMAGALLDLQVGLGSSQIMNPVTGVPSTVLAQYKFLLATVVFLSLNGHHFVIGALAGSYETMPTVTAAHFGSFTSSFVELLSRMCLIALQIAAPVAAVGFIVDAAMGIINKAVPQMQVFMVGLPGKIILGLLALSLGLPALVGGVQFGMDQLVDSVSRTLTAR